MSNSFLYCVFWLISIHVPAKGTTSGNPAIIGNGDISIHVPAKGTTAFYSGYTLTHEISIHVPAKGTTPIQDLSAPLPEFQSTFPRRERQPRLSLFLYAKRHFNPRSREGNDPCFFHALNDNINFNPRSREGNDERSRNDALMEIISIHVPAKGTTVRLHMFGDQDNISIHVPAKGTTWGNHFIYRKTLFQSTFPRRERRQLD